MGIINDEMYSGINNHELKSLCSNINKISDNVATILSSVDDNMEELSLYYKSSSYDELMKKYNEFRKNFEIIKGNINSYAIELGSLEGLYEDNSKVTISKIEVNKEDIKNQNKTIL